ncbi:MAG: HTTM domain-containing protein [Bacteroidota bacterium]
MYATGKVSLNGGPLQPLYDSSVNLADVEWQPFTHASWLLPINR